MTKQRLIYWQDYSFSLPPESEEKIAQILAPEAVQDVVSTCRWYLGYKRSHDKRPNLKTEVAPALRDFIKETRDMIATIEMFAEKACSMADSLWDLPEPAIHEIQSLSQKRYSRDPQGAESKLIKPGEIRGKYRLPESIPSQFFQIAEKLSGPHSLAERLGYIADLAEESELLNIEGKGRPPGAENPDWYLVDRLAEIYEQTHNHRATRTVDPMTNQETKNPLADLVTILAPHISCGTLTGIIQKHRLLNKKNKQ